MNHLGLMRYSVQPYPVLFHRLNPRTSRTIIAFIIIIIIPVIIIEIPHEIDYFKRYIGQ